MLETLARFGRSEHSPKLQVRGLAADWLRRLLSGLPARRGPGVRGCLR